MMKDNVQFVRQKQRQNIYNKTLVAKGQILQLRPDTSAFGSPMTGSNPSFKIGQITWKYTNRDKKLEDLLMMSDYLKQTKLSENQSRQLMR